MSEPDAPRSFGSRCVWLAVTSTDAPLVVKALGLRTVLPANWRAGLAEIAERGVFVTPPIDGFVLVVGPDLRNATSAAADVVPPLLERLSQIFGSAAWFASHVDADVHGWAVAHHGVLARGYAFAGDEGHVFWQGEVTEAEHGLGCFVDDPRDGSDDAVKWWPDERLVAELAAAWSLDPRRLGERGLPPSCGWVGRL